MQQTKSYSMSLILWLVALSFIWIITFILNVFVGSESIPLNEILKICIGQNSSNDAYELIVLEYRLPKAITASFAGGCLALSGLLMQTLFRNPLAGPFILGTSSGASLGVALLVLGSVSFSIPLSNWLGEFSIILAACLGSSVLMGMILLASQKIKQPVTLLIMGLMFGYAASALVSILTHFSSAEQIQSFAIWNMGTFANVTWEKMIVFIPILLIAILIAFLASYPLNVLLLGESYAKSMGMNIKKIRFWVICSASILAGTVTSFCGPIAFLGVAVPHVARRILKRAEHRSLIPLTILSGMSIALLSDIIASVPGSETTLPLNSITSLVGAPFVIFIILKRTKGQL